MSYDTLRVELGQRSYSIFVGTDLFKALPKESIPQDYKDVFIVTNETVAPLYLSQCVELCKRLSDDALVDSLILPDGEKYKTFETLQSIFDALLKKQYSRSALIVALGGGVIGDITGFAAACYQRGIDLIQIPTTLLSQVDASVGGKTAINHPLGKNMIGAFHQPRAVYINLDTLKSLPEREFNAGLAEVVKYGLIQSQDFLTWIEQNLEKIIARDNAALKEMVLTSCQMKANIVAADETEANTRALLNLGHTFGHAIEKTLGYGTWLHGEAVSAGMVLAARASQTLGYITPDEVARIETLLLRCHLPVKLPGHASVEQILYNMRYDKKIIHKNIRLILLKHIGQAIIVEKADEKLLKDTLTALR